MKKLVYLLLAFILLQSFKYGGKENQNPKIQKFDLPGGAKIKMIWVDSGSFMMGNSLINKQTKVNITKGFWLAETEITQEQWESVMKSNPSHHKGSNLPVDQVSFMDVMKFIKTLNDNGGDFRLPTESEWEYACRAGTKGAYSGDRELSVWHSGNSGRQSHEVKQKHANPWGFYDMQGNMLEWCSDWYQESIYTTIDQTDPIGPDTGTYHVQRGGQFTGRTRHTEVYDRQYSSPTTRMFYVGFRLAHETINK